MFSFNSSLQIIELLNGATLSISGSSTKDSNSSENGGIFMSWLTSLDWNTVRFLVFGIAFAIVGLYQYYKWKSNKKAKESKIGRAHV